MQQWKQPYNLFFQANISAIPELDKSMVGNPDLSTETCQSQFSKSFRDLSKKVGCLQSYKIYKKALIYLAIPEAARAQRLALVISAFASLASV